MVWTLVRFIFPLYKNIASNKYKDITHEDFAAEVCGYTEEDMNALISIFGLADKRNELHDYYDGYSFSYDTTKRVVN